jgi:hypothetical protein
MKNGTSKWKKKGDLCGLRQGAVAVEIHGAHRRVPHGEDAAEDVVWQALETHPRVDREPPPGRHGLDLHVAPRGGDALRDGSGERARRGARRPQAEAKGQLAFGGRVGGGWPLGRIPCTPLSGLLLHAVVQLSVGHLRHPRVGDNVDAAVPEDSERFFL